ncbi:TIGR03087 family PEP-CTERM/XrtA system glycosyltransferase [Gayadomonas joobiniege]|uniref:TIGR03087 family PEP-CTERM/XrtA system glycosyltransferase n=1 Tax=Gayadomonas joobiniege TaxID=1234606 RepID=UPI0003799DA7|nr:TIGR03087 family PEP-CTERM/XrtA system glycosyltransferase [Gayadomonas joobiniege]
MHLLVLAHRLPYPPNKGEKIRTYHQIEYLIQMGHQVTLLAPAEASDDRIQADRLQQKVGCQVTVFAQPWRKLKMLVALLTKKSLSVANFYNNGLQKLFDQMLGEQTYDAVLCTASSMAEYILQSQAIKNSNVELMMDFMDLDSDKWRQYSEHATWPMQYLYKREWQLLAPYENRIHNTFDHCLFVSEQEVALFAKQLDTPCKAVAIGNGIDLSMFSVCNYHQKPQPPELLFTGVMDYQPNVDAVIWFVNHVWPTLKHNHPEIKFIIAGMNPTPAVTALAKNKDVEVTGFVENIVPYYDNARIFVAPFRLARGVQNKVLQALACGIPVVATPMGAEGIECEAADGLITANTASQFAKEIDRLIEQPDKAAELAIAARACIEHKYSWQTQLAQLHQMLGAERA